MPDILKVADSANMIVNGYAFTEENGVIRVLNLNHPERVLQNFSSKVMATRWYRIKGCLPNESCVKFRHSSRIIIRKCTSSGQK